MFLETFVGRIKNIYGANLIGPLFADAFFNSHRNKRLHAIPITFNRERGIVEYSVKTGEGSRVLQGMY